MLSAASYLQLHKLDLRRTYLRDEGCKALATALSRLGPCLRALTLACDESGHEGIAAAAGTLQALTGLTRLQAAYFSELQVMAALAPALKGMRRLQVLNLHKNRMGYQGIAAFAAVLPSFAGSLKHLGLPGCSIAADAAAGLLSPELAPATGLTELRLSFNLLGPQGAQWLASLLSALPYPRHVLAAAAAARVMKNSTSLTAVSLSAVQPYSVMAPPLTVSNLLAAGAATGLAPRMRKLTGVQADSQGTDRQLQALQQCTSLTHLDFDGSQLGNWLTQKGAQGAALLSAALQGMRGLTYLRVGNSNLQPQHAAALASTL